MIKQPLIFLGAAVFFAMVTIVGFAFIETRGYYFCHWFMMITSGAFMVLSLAGIVAPKKMQWLMDFLKKKNEES